MDELSIYEAKNNDSLTFLHCLEGVVGLNKFYGVGDFLTLQNVIVEAEVGDGQLEDLIVPHSVLLENGTCGGTQAVILQLGKSHNLGNCPCL